MLTVAVLALLTLISVVAPAKLFGFRLKQANIYSDVLSDSAVRAFVGLPTDLRTMEQRIADIADRNEAMIDRILDSVDMLRESARAMRMKQLAELPVGVIPIEDFSENGYLLESFYEALTKAEKRQVRIAVLGDSFIEGDIMTADLREKLQDAHSGAGVGYVPIVSNVAKFRGSLQHDFNSSDWVQHSILKESSRADYTLSGFTFIPQKEGAWVEYSGNKFKRHLNTFSQATLLFINKGNTKIRATINGSRVEEFTPESSEHLQAITVEDSIFKVRFEVENIADFTAYGALLDNKTGVSVDNYSIRGNSGVGLVALNKEICAEMSLIAPYELIVLEYGLNVVEEEATNYGYYRTQMMNVVNHIKECYPGVPIVLMGVSDRSTMSNGSFVTMPGVVAMDKTQRDIAKRCGVTFWSTLEAMRQLGGMEKFVENGWAAKDYTHLGSRGGSKVALKFFEGISVGK